MNPHEKQRRKLLFLASVGLCIGCLVTAAEARAASCAKRQEIVKQIRNLNVKSIFVESSVNSETLDLIAKDAGVEVGGKLYSDAMGPRDSAAETYLGMMRENVLTIVNALR